MRYYNKLPHSKLRTSCTHPYLPPNHTGAVQRGAEPWHPRVGPPPASLRRPRSLPPPPPRLCSHRPRNRRLRRPTAPRDERTIPRKLPGKWLPPGAVCSACTVPGSWLCATGVCVCAGLPTCSAWVSSVRCALPSWAAPRQLFRLGAVVSLGTAVHGRGGWWQPLCVMLGVTVAV